MGNVLWIILLVICCGANLWAMTWDSNQLKWFNFISFLFCAFALVMRI